MDFAKVKAGDDFNFPAPFYNALVDSLARQRESAKTGGKITAPQLSSNIIRIQNNTGYPLNRYDLVGLGGALVEKPSTVDTDRLFITQKIILEGEVLDIDVHVGKWGMLLEHTPENSIGRAVINGLATMNVYVQDADHEYCEIALFEEAGPDGEDIIRLSTVAQSRNRILWVEPDRVEETKLAYAYVLIGAGAGLPQLYEATDNAADNVIHGKQVKSDTTLIGEDIEFFALD